MFAEVLGAICLVFLVCAITYVLKYVQKRQILKVIPTCDGELFFIGHSYMLKTDSVEFYNQIFEYILLFKDEPMFSFWIGPQPMIVCNHPESVEAVLASNEVINKGYVYTFLHPWLGLGLLTAGGEKWKGRRKMLTPAFHFSIIQHYYSTMNENSRALIDVIENNLSLKSDQTLDILPLITLCALDIICEAAMGYKLDALHSNNAAYVDAISDMTDIIMQRMKKIHLHPDLFFALSSWGRKHKKNLNIIHGFTRHVIQQRKEEMRLDGDLLSEEDNSSGKRRRLAFLDLLLHEQKKNNSLSDDEIQEEVDTFMFEGHDTTSVAMTWCVYLLGLHPEIQAKVHEELDSVLPSRTCDITADHIGRLQYLDKVIKESLRLFPSVPYIARSVNKDFNIMGRKIPSGSTLMVMPSALHRHPNVFEDPLEFRPERFLPENCIHRHPFSYIPFSAGPRNCIGAKVAQMEEKIVLSWIFRHYIVKSKQPFSGIRAAGEIILRPVDGIIVEFERRD